MKVVMISGAAGVGKTTVLGTLADGSMRPFEWLDLPTEAVALGVARAGKDLYIDECPRETVAALLNCKGSGTAYVVLREESVERCALNIQELQDACHAVSWVAGWWDFPREDGMLSDAAKLARYAAARVEILTPHHKAVAGAVIAQKLCLIHSEISEAMEGHRKGLMDDKLPHRTMLEVELADAMIRILDLAGAMKLDLAGAIDEKMAYNADRPDHKPEARQAAGGKSY